VVAKVASHDGIVAALGMPPELETDDYCAYADAVRNEVVIRISFRWFERRAFGLVRYRMQKVQDGVLVTSTYMPIPGNSYYVGGFVLALGILVSGHAAMLPILFIFGFVGAMQIFLSKRALEQPALAIFSQIERGLRDLK
jgi:hypothetical protein